MRPFLVQLALIASAGFCVLSQATSSSSSSSQLQPPLFMRSLANNAYMKFERCLRVKITENNDDDGNSYFYNGSYRSQSMPFLAYRMCDDCSCSGEGTTFVASLNEVMENQIQYTQSYCNSCSAVCRRRRLNDGDGEEEEEEEEGGFENVVANCKTCVDQCAPLLQNYYEGYDETEYLECQAAFKDDNGLQYYSAPSCNDEGKLAISLFYDDECTVKRNDDSGYSGNFGYNTFLSMESICMDCADGICDDIEETLECEDGKNQNYNVDDEMYACKAYKKAAKEWTYAKARHDKKLGLIVLVVAFSSIFLFGSYTYFVRHKNAEKAATIAASETTAAEYAVMT
mmetsp:Transcript_19187/g.24693  ORF Transcript_19187/g.24693 Transcript_19187/m.24693 type:complete len:342 (+) Transcript_19187:261-1286(+)|eukprot:CAMPEP_0198138660 /NCGR_PEP_ID=MMETSP1443-20131203/2056_1 /TAXON_ID=186043 /ORGANISM="Entomoneis sp., Strain CCMP2396" /LENGTH=341 /DNA_ID=CAMNT_0043800541 /DNA_START=218 /DNA_END=1243 /DNA_ORIENTATION=-